MTEEMNNLVQLRGRLKTSITRALAYVENPPEDCTFEEVETRLERLGQVWENFIKSTDKMYAYKQAADYSDPNIDFVIYEDKFLSARARLCTLRRALLPPADSTTHVDSISKLVDQQATFLQQFSSSAIAPHRESELPKINIPQFSGQYKDWPSFRDLFVSSIDRKSGLTDTQKFHYLKSLLKDEAANLLKHMSVTDAAYETAWRRLTDRFDRPRHIVNAFIESFMSLPAVSTENSHGMRKLADGANEIIRGLDSIRQTERDCWLIHLLLAKIDPESRSKWVHESRENSSPTLVEFFEFLDGRCEELELSNRKSNSVPKHTITKQTSSRSFVTVDSRIQKCIKCSATNHYLLNCPTFLALPVEERRLFAKGKSLCFNCLKLGHTSYNCLSKFRCRECSRRHHTLVHSAQQAPLNAPVLTDSTVASSSSLTSTHTPPSVVSPSTPWSTAANCTSSNSALESSPSFCTAQTPVGNIDKRSLLPTALVEIRNSHGEFVTCRVLLDSASELSYISERCAQRLALPRSPSHFIVSGISSVKAAVTRGCCSLLIKSKINEKFINARAFVLSKITASVPSTTIDIFSSEQLKGLPLADPTFNIASPIDILLGTQYFWNIFTFNKIYDMHENPIAVSSIFGWIVTHISTKMDQETSSFVTVVDIDQALRNFWEIEEANFVAPIDADDSYVEQHFVKTHSRHADGKYIVHLPFKMEKPTFSYTYQGALNRFNSVERRLLKDRHLRQQYVSFMRDYIQLGHMRELKSDEIDLDDNNVFYMPHHPVIGVKLRVVFDGSFQDANGVSLNNTLHIGPSIQRNLFAVCLRFRFHRYVFCADIVKMFRQIWVTEAHRNYQRILWREEPSQRLKHFQLNTVTYGTSCAPFLAVRVLEQLAYDYKTKHPCAAKILLEDFYVDDVITGAETERSLIEKRDELVKVLSYAGLELRKWVSNCDHIISNSDDQSCRDFTKQTNNEGTKVLGIYWQPHGDRLLYKLCLEESAVATKRQVLSDIARIFDPLGLLAPIVIQFKMLFQELWLHDLKWDDPLPANASATWFKCRTDLANILKFSLPRFVYNAADEIELHGFSDASTKAYSAAVYCRARDEDGVVQVALVAAKTRVAPLKQLSLPRLELCGALLLTRLMHSIAKALPHKTIAIRAWCDSTVVLAWLSQTPVKLKTFIANRTAEIIDTMPRNIWNHVASKENPADCATRGMLASQLMNFNLWWKGPVWLSNDEKYQLAVNKGKEFNFMQAESESDVIAELKGSTINLLITEESEANPICSLVERVSTWRRLLRVTAYVLRFVRLLQTHNRRLTVGYLTFNEIHAARVLCLRLAQNCFSVDRKKLLNKIELNKHSKLLQLTPFTDADGLIRVGGRICNSDLDVAAQHPILLPKNHRVTHLILIDEHEKHLHPGVSALFVIVRQKYWVQGARNLIRNLTHKCIRCFRLRQLSTQQLMADLPAVRVRQAHPFENTGCDYAGPLTLKLYSGRNARTSKGYICLFVCLVTSAIHLELATDLSTECFLAALRRFMSRRGKCSQIFSDNGRNFLGASRSLNEMLKVITSQVHNEIVAASLAEDGIRWSYIPPHAPHWGGLWESAVRSVKLHLRRVIGNVVLTFEQMHTLLAQIEAVVNSRPLGVSSDTETNYLSPSHFLIGRPYTMVPEGDLSTVNVNRLNYWQHVQNMYQGFWRRWHQEYLTSLQQRPKWSQRQPNVAVGNIVVVKESNTPPAKWLMAKVLEVYPGRDGLVRVVKLRTAHGEMTRPIAKIVVLPVS